MRKCGLYLRLRVHLCGVCDGKRRVQRRERENTLMKHSVTKRERERDPRTDGTEGRGKHLSVTPTP